MKDYEILMGACGWDHAVWQQEYYPPDLPAEWRLAYYGNEFPVVMIPAHEGISDAVDIERWIEDTDEAPAFIAEIPEGVARSAQAEAMNAWLARLAPLGSRLLGLCCPVWVDAPLPALLAAIPEHMAICLEGRDAASEAECQSILADCGREAGWCWHGQGTPACFEQGSLAIARIDSQTISPRELRTVVEACRAAANDQRRVVLLADGDPPDLQVLRDAEVILDLL
jgi:hypothetical protein